MLIDPRSHRSRRGLLTGLGALLAYAALPVRPAGAQMLMTGVGGPPAAPPPSFTTWDTANSREDLVFSNGNRTVQCNPGGWGIVRSLGTVTGQARIEHLVNPANGGYSRIGLVNASFAVTGGILGEDTDSVAFLTNGEVRFNGGNVLAGFTYGDGSLVALECDEGAGLMWPCMGGSRAAIGQTIPSGTLYWAVQVGASDNKYASNFGQSPWVVSPQTTGFVGI